MFVLRNWRNALMYQAVYYSLLASLLKRSPIFKPGLFLGEVNQCSPFNTSPPASIVISICEAVNRVSNKVPWECECLVKASTGMFMLKRCNYASTIYLGTKKNQDGNLIAHAWLRCGEQYLFGGENKDEYTVVTTFSNINKMRE